MASSESSYYWRMTSHAVTPQTLGAWVIKCNPSKTDLEPMVAAGRAHEHWCVAANYRSRLMAAGQPVLFWVTGARHRGIWGVGRLTGRPISGSATKVGTDIPLLREPLGADMLASIPELGGLEVFRSPQQSNPSWVDVREWAVLRTLLPDVSGNP